MKLSTAKLDFSQRQAFGLFGSVSRHGNREGYPQGSPPCSTLWSTDGATKEFQLTLVSVQQKEVLLLLDRTSNCGIC